MSRMFSHLLSGVAFAAVALSLGLLSAAASAQTSDTKPPNILVIWGDDIGGFNISAYNRGMMGYKAPNIDSIAKEGALFTDWYGQQSCTAGRAGGRLRCPVAAKLPRVPAAAEARQLQSRARDGIGDLRRRRQVAS